MGIEKINVFQLTNDEFCASSWEVARGQCPAILPVAKMGGLLPVHWTTPVESQGPNGRFHGSTNGDRARKKNRSRVG